MRASSSKGGHFPPTDPSSGQLEGTEDRSEERVGEEERQDGTDRGVEQAKHGAIGIETELEAPTTLATGARGRESERAEIAIDRK